MPIAFDCPTCGKKFSVRDDLAGKKARCKDCGGPIQIPETVVHDLADAGFHADQEPESTMGPPLFRVYVHEECGTEMSVQGRGFSVMVNPFVPAMEAPCVECEKDLPYDRFVWADTGENVAEYRRRLRTAMPLGRRLFFRILGSLVAGPSASAAGLLIAPLIHGPIRKGPRGPEDSRVYGAGVGAVIGLLGGPFVLTAPLMRFVWGIDYRREP